MAQTKALGEAMQQLTPAERACKAPQRRPTVQRVLYYHCDHLGTPQELTDREGNIVWAAEYAAWGKVRKIDRPGPKPRGGATPGSGFGGLGAAGLGQSSAARFPTHGNAALQPVFEDDTAANETVFAEPVEQHLRFQGQYFDAETGLHYNRFRYYDPECGRFVSLDPIGLRGGTNQFQYTPNPTGWLDVSGLARCRKSSCPKWMKPKKGSERHHIIPHELKDHPIFAASGMDIKSAQNMMYLPRKDGDESGKAKHSNFQLGDCPHNEYNERTREKLDQLSETAKKEKWDRYRIQDELLNLQKSLRSSLSAGVVP